MASSSAVLRTIVERGEKDTMEARAELRVERDLRARDIEGLREESNARENRAIELEGDLARVREVSAAEKAGLERREEELRSRHADAMRALREDFASLTAQATATTQDRITKWASQSLAVQTQTASGDLEQKKQAVEAMVKPIAEALARADAKLSQIDKDRAQSQTALEEQLKSMREASGKLSEETRRLGEALRKPDVRGRYGEMQLRRVAELAGMVEYCDFATQVSVDGPSKEGREGESSKQRPDMVVTMPSGRKVIVDAKTNIQGYLDALHASTPEEAGRHLDKFAQHVVQQAIDLSNKNYWKHFEGSPEFVVMFVPGDQFIDAALARQPDLLDLAAQRNVILASPSTLIGLLRAVAIGYREERLAKEAEGLRTLGREFLERVANVVEPLAVLGRQLELAASSYNKFVGSYETRLLPTLQKFEEAGVSSKKKLEVLGGVGTQTRRLTAAEQEPLDKLVEGKEVRSTDTQV